MSNTLDHTFTFDTLTLAIRPDPRHDWLMSSQDVASGYGITPETIRGHKFSHGDELVLDRHYVTVGNPNGGSPITFWTKQGILRLGFFVKSERARLFRDCVEKQLLGVATLDQNADLALEILGVLTTVRRSQLEMGGQISRVQNTVTDLNSDVETMNSRLVQIEGELANSVITPEQDYEIKGMVHNLASLIAPGDKQRFGIAYRLLFGRFKISRGRDLPRAMFDEAKHFLGHQIAAHTPPPIIAPPLSSDFI